VQVYDAVAAPSPLSLPGAVNRCVELFSFAKSYQLGGFRLGFALGNAEALAALEAVKAPIDFNQYLGEKFHHVGAAAHLLQVYL
jgi:aspartate/methionine/tyrosine aminotransferase